MKNAGKVWIGRKHSEESKKKMSATHSKQYLEHPEIREKLSKAMTGKKLPEEHKKHIGLGMGITYQRIIDESIKLEEQGYRVIPIAHVIPDIIAIKDGKVYAFEVEYGNPNYKKYDKDHYRKYFDEVVWLVRKAKRNAS